MAQIQSQSEFGQKSNKVLSKIDTGINNNTNEDLLYSSLSHASTSVPESSSKYKSRSKKFNSHSHHNNVAANVVHSDLDDNIDYLLEEVEYCYFCAGRYLKIGLESETSAHRYKKKKQNKEDSSQDYNFCYDCLEIVLAETFKKLIFFTALLGSTGLSAYGPYSSPYRRSKSCNANRSPEAFSVTPEELIIYLLSSAYLTFGYFWERQTMTANGQPSIKQSWFMKLYVLIFGYLLAAYTYTYFTRIPIDSKILGFPVLSTIQILLLFIVFADWFMDTIRSLDLLFDDSKSRSKKTARGGPNKTSKKRENDDKEVGSIFSGPGMHAISFFALLLGIYLAAWYLE